MSKRTRRQFLEDSMFAAAAAVAASSSTKSLANDEQSSSPNAQLNVAVVGVRGRGKSHIGAFSGRKDTRVACIVDVDAEVGRERVAEVKKRQGGAAPRFVTDMREAFDDNRIDIVSIATPNHWHALAAIWAIQAGKDVYLEKPVSHNVSEGRRIVAAARKHERICQTGTQSRSNPGMQQAMQFIQDGGIGHVKLARGLCYKRRPQIESAGHFAPPTSVDYNLWLGPAAEKNVTRAKFHHDWHWQWEYGNGDLGNQGIHQMDIARWGLGLNRLSDHVFSYGGRFGYADAGETANTQVVMHDFNQQSLIFEVRGLSSAGYRNSKVGVIFEGTEGYVVMTTYYSGAAFDRNGKQFKAFNSQGDHFANFIKAVRSRRITDLNADIEQGHLSSALCHLGNISYQLGTEQDIASARQNIAAIQSNDRMEETLNRTLAHLKNNGVNTDSIKMHVGPNLAFDPITETFRNSAAANAKLSRQYRAPFVIPTAEKV